MNCDLIIGGTHGSDGQSHRFCPRRRERRLYCRGAPPRRVDNDGSNQVQALEDSLGVRLLNRTTRSVGLTEIGREYYERCSQILHELAEADEMTSALQMTPRGRLRLRCHHALERSIAPVAARFAREYPEVSR